MGTTSLQADRNPRRKRSLTLSSFHKAAPSDSQQALAASAAAEVRKAAAWQWYTRALGEVVVPTTRPAARGAPPKTAVEDAGAGGRANLVRSKGGADQESGWPSHEKKPSLHESRFKVEASARVRQCLGGTPPTATAGGASANPLIATPAPLYDEVELSGLKVQMTDFVQRMQQKQQVVKPRGPAEAPPHYPPLFLPLTEADPAGIRRSISSSTHVSGFRRPFSALHRFFHRVMSGSFYKSSSAAAIAHELKEDLAPPVITSLGPHTDDVQYHYHHYIHHHHHHYHYGSNPEEPELNSRRRRHSESSGIRPRIPASKWEENKEGAEDNREESPLRAFLARRRRHSDSTFAAEVRNSGCKADGGSVMKQTVDEEGLARPAAKRQLPARRFSSERYANGNKVLPEEYWKHEGNGREGLWQSGADVKSRRRHSAEVVASYGEWRRDGRAAMELGGLRAASRGGGVYKLSGAGVNYSCEREPARGRWRPHSESFDRRAEGLAHAHEEVNRDGGYIFSTDEA
ncbi:hypothetical protein L7F22_010334 [Adiantum nelumboides]|nr:hypothetical protein [Adiantum nelumboides]